MKLSRLSLVTKILFLLILFYWIWSIASLFPQFLKVFPRGRDFFSYSYGLIAMIGGIGGLLSAQKWGGVKSILGRGIFMLSLGLLSQWVGQFSYLYYVEVLKVDIPYPSLGDLGWFMTIPFYFYGAFLLAKASGMKTSLKRHKYRVFSVIIPAIMLIISYMVFLQNYPIDLSHPLVMFFDFGYPLGHSIYISMTILVFILSRDYLGGVMKKTIMLLLSAMVLQYLGDFSFLYLVINEIYFVGGLYDYFFLASYSIMAIALLNFSSIYSHLQEVD